MRTALQYVLSVIFIVQMYLMMAVLAVYWTPIAFLRRDAAFDAVHSYCRWVRASAALLIGLKSEIRGWYGKRIGCIPVDRGKRGEAMKKMVADVKSGLAEPGQLIIYPQGTRVAAGATKPYKVGVGVLYSQTGQDCVPAATNVGVFWPRHGILRKPGLAVVEFLPRIPAGLPVEDFMARIEREVEGCSNRLMAEAGFEAGHAQHG